MIQLLFSVLIGVGIGSITNEFAIRMLFRPYEPWRIGGWKVPFTPGLIPKRREELAEQLGHMVEKYLFTAKGLKEFLENTGVKQKLYEKLLEKINEFQEKKETLGEIFPAEIKRNLKEGFLSYSKEKIFFFLFVSEFREKSLEQILPESVIGKIEDQFQGLAKTFIQEIKVYLHSDQGSKWLESIVLQLLEGKKMLGFLAGMLFDGGQIQHKLVEYLDQFLDNPDSEQLFTEFLHREWNQWKGKPIRNVLDPMELYLKGQIEEWLDQGVHKIEEIPLKPVIEKMFEKDLFQQLYDRVFEHLEVRLEKWFGYLSISKVVKEEVNRFSLRELEKMIVEISGKELKMITVFGGILGGIIGLVQGLIFYFYSS